MKQVLRADRIAFKRWAKNRGFNILREYTGERPYCYPLTEICWQAWKAACEWKEGGKVDDATPEDSVSVG